ncbi:MAG: hypothetical protein ACTSPY_03770 [Candidatus Helarchaeota archaeon]
MQSTREIIETIIEMIKDEVSDNSKEFLNKIMKFVEKADFRRKYYRIKIWKMFSEFKNSNPSISDVIDNILTDLAVKWENTMSKALNDGLLSE